ncbi:MAG: MerR family transcriptional regulator [Fibrobacteres bacterium]|jgi:DNA-binding transcriptional MerR regulator|nr:MerR family transcriptional regulator [Fibrobacterota bacterium]
MGTFRITELAKRFGLARSTLLHYDRLGLLKPGVRTAADYRLYTEADLVRLERICAFREAGLGLADIALLLDSDGEETGILERRLREIGQEVASLRAQQRVLAGMLRTAAAGSSAPGLDGELWLELRRACGFDREAMVRWHREFERRSPRGHHDFLTGLGLSENEVVHIRMLTKNIEGNQEAMKCFNELFDELPRQGPGSDESTVRALGLAKIEVLKASNSGVLEAQEVYARCQLEAQMHRSHAKSYGYAFFVLRKESSL